jgi:hypothetical protein
MLSDVRVPQHSKPATAKDIDAALQGPQRERGLWSFLTWSFFLSQVVAAQAAEGGAAQASGAAELARSDYAGGVANSVGGSLSSNDFSAVRADEAEASSTPSASQQVESGSLHAGAKMAGIEQLDWTSDAGASLQFASGSGAFSAALVTAGDVGEGTPGGSAPVIESPPVGEGPVVIIPPTTPGVVVIPPIVDEVVDVVDAVIPPIDTILTPVIDIIDGLPGVLNPVVDGVLEPVVNIVDDLIEELGSTLDGLLTPVVETLEDLAGVVGATLDDVLSPVETLADNLAGSLGEVLNPVLAPVASLAEGVGELLEPVGGIAGELIGLADPVLDVVEPLLSPVADVVEAVQPILDPILEVAAPIVDLVQPVIEPLLQPLAPVTEPVLELLPVGGVLDGLFGDESGAANEAAPLPSVDNVLETAAAPVVDLVEPIVQPVLELASPLVDLVQPVIQPVLDILPTNTGGILNVLTGGNGESDAIGSSGTIEFAASAEADAYELTEAGAYTELGITMHETPASTGDLVDDLVGNVVETVSDVLGEIGDGNSLPSLLGGIQHGLGLRGFGEGLL